MQIPKELKAMLGRLDSNAEYLIDFPEELVFRALRTSNPIQRAVAKRFLDDLLNSTPSYQDLQKVWWSGPVEIIFKDENYLRDFFKLMRDQLETTT
ncbi:MAG: hypothetical protein HY659_00435 [Rhizobiales bacterium]|nr:hypothetical protein [Hyphomicrobiales bacterium]